MSVILLWLVTRFMFIPLLVNTPFTDLDYTDDTACPSEWLEILTDFDSSSQTMGLHTSWSKIKFQNTGYGLLFFPS